MAKGRSVHKIKGGYSRARKDGSPHSGKRPPTAKQLAFIERLREQVGDTKTFIPDTRLEAADVIAILPRRARKQANSP